MTEGDTPHLAAKPALVDPDMGQGTIEGYTTFGVGTRARLPFRVFTLSGPGNQSRIVIDVAHQWSQ